MSDVIKLLPDTIANQIAAGEVIQRPASVVKELLENAIDAGSTEIRLDVKDAGKTLVMVTDNGRGMSETDARMSIERHATSKISSADDLFAIRTMGFRGEALASIAAIAQMEIKTKTEDASLGTKLVIKGGKVEEQLPEQSATGTQIAVKNLFFNVPARRKFLKSDNVELRHIIDEFERVALANPDIKFVFHHNGTELFNLPKSRLKQRIIGIFGKKYDEKLVPLKQETTVVNISGFVLKPDSARKTRGEQFFFVNGRFIKSAYLHMMVARAYEELIPQGYYPGYFIYLELDPGFIDINIHPTKTEIKFEDERTVGMLLNSSVKQAIGMHNVAPTLDFDQETSFNVPPLPSGSVPKPPQISYKEGFNPFETGREKPTEKHWEAIETFYSDAKSAPPESGSDSIFDEEKRAVQAMQVKRKYILSSINSGLIVIHQSRAHQRILFDEILEGMSRSEGTSQQLLFPETVNLTPADMLLVKELADDLRLMGFDFSEFGKTTVVIRGIPPVASGTEGSRLLAEVLESFRAFSAIDNLGQSQKLALSLAFKSAVKTGKALSEEEMLDLIDRLFSCENPATLPDGRKIYYTLSLDELNNRFN